MEKKRKHRQRVLIICAIIVLVVGAISIAAAVINGLSNTLSDTASDPSDTYDIVQTTSTSVSDTSEPVMIPIATDVPLIDPDFLFNDAHTAVSQSNSFLDRVLGHDIDTLTVTFDGFILKPGMFVRDIIDTTLWYTNKQDDVLQAGEACYVVLSNDNWTNESLRLNNDVDAGNGEVILWVYNYNSIPTKLRDCIIYKYKINYRNASVVYKDQPVLSYMNEYHLGYHGVYPQSSETVTLSDSNGTFIRHIYGSIDECQVLLDKDNANGLFAITVSYNEFYGPVFEKR